MKQKILTLIALWCLTPIIAYSQIDDTTLTALGVVEYTPVPKLYRVHMYLKKYNNVEDMVGFYKETLRQYEFDTNKVGQTVTAAIPDNCDKDKYVYFYYDADTQEEMNELTDVFLPPLKYNGIEVFYEYDKKTLEDLTKRASKAAHERAEILAAENGRILGKLLNLTEFNTDYTEGYSEDIRNLRDKKRFIIKVVYEADRLRSN